MNLDTGTYYALTEVDISGPGDPPQIVHKVSGVGWYGELSFETAPAYPTPERQEVRTDLRIRVLQNRTLTNHCRILCGCGAYADLGTDWADERLTELIAQDFRLYEVIRAYHGRDDDNGELITDLTLMEVAP